MVCNMRSFVYATGMFFAVTGFAVDVFCVEALLLISKC